MTITPTSVETPSGIARDATTGVVTITSQRLARMALADPHLDVVSDPDVAVGYVPPDDAPLSVSEFYGAWFSRSPRHRQVRRELREAYAAGCVHAYVPTFTEVADALLAELPDSGDLLAGYLTPYGVRTTALMCGIPEREWGRVDKVVTLVTAFMKKPLDGAVVATHRQIEMVETCIRYLRALVDDLLAEPEVGPLVAGLRRIAAADDAGVWLAVITLGQLLAAGVEPMTTGAALATRELYGRPGLLDDVRAGRVDVHDVAEEAMRLEPPFPVLHRWVQQDCSCLGLDLPAGTYVGIDLRRVNRDPAEMADPEAFDPGRQRHLNLTFGRGSHYCLGMRSGREQIAVALTELLRLRPGIRVDVGRSTVADLGYAASVAALPYRTEVSA